MTSWNIELLLKISAVVNIWFLLVAMANMWFFRRRSAATPLTDGPLVSVIVPARNEELNLGRCIRALACQSYRNIEIIIVDDNSTDKTWRVAQRLENEYRHVISIQGKSLPENWLGKPFASHQGAQKAAGDILFFTDADVVHAPDSVGWAVAAMDRNGSDFLSAFVRHHVGSVGEAIIVPVMYFLTSIILPLVAVFRLKLRATAFAIGQYIVCTREAYDSVGGLAAVSDSVVEDMEFARLMKEHGFTTVFLDAKERGCCRMYEGTGHAIRGLSKSVYGAIGGRPIVLLLLSFFVAAAILAPAFMSIRWIAIGDPRLPLAAFPAITFSVIWAACLYDRRFPVYLYLLYPFTYSALLLIAALSWIRTGVGSGELWKGRLVKISRVKNEVLIDVRPLYRCLSWVVFMATYLAVWLYSLLVIRLKIDGKLSADDTPSILVSNHLLYVDSGIVARCMFPRRTYFSALAETFRRPIIGPYIRLLGAFPLPENATFAKIIPVIKRALRTGWFVHFFPEGELSLHCQRPDAFKLGAFFAAYLCNADVVPLTFVLIPKTFLGRPVEGKYRVKAVFEQAMDPRRFVAAAGSVRKGMEMMAEDARLTMCRTIEREHEAAGLSALHSGARS